MDMSDKNFDTYFRDRLQDHSSPVPADMWQRIIPEKQRRRKFFFWIWSFAGAILVVAGLFVRHRISTPTPQTVTLHTEQSDSSGSVPSSSSPGILAPSTPASTTPPLSAPGALPSSVPKTPLSSVFPMPSSPVPTNHSFVPQTQPSSLHQPRAYHLSLSPYPVSRRPVTARSLPLSPTGQKNKKQKPVLPKWYVDACFSPDIALVDLREWSYTTGIRFSKQLGPHFSAKIGLQYSHLGEKAKIDSEGLHIRLTTLDIPLLAGYETNIGRLTTTFTGGIIFNIHSWNTLGPGFTTHDIYKTNTGLSLYLGLNFAQPLNKKFSLFAEPYIRYRLSDISNYPALFDSKMNTAGLLLGLRYKH